MTKHTPKSSHAPTLRFTPRLYRTEEAAEGLHIMVLKILQEYGDLVCWRTNQDVYLLNHPDLIRPILTREHRHLSKNTLTHGILRRVMGNGLITTDGPEWARQRRLAQPLFTSRAVVRFDTPIKARTEALVARWEQEASGGDGGEAVLRVDQEMTALTFGILGETLFGCDVGEHAAEMEEIIEGLNLPFDDPRALAQTLNPRASTPGSQMWKRAIEQLDDLAFRIIAERRRDRNGNEVLLDRILAAPHPVTGEDKDDRQIRDEVVSLILAGHETTAMACAWSLYLLATHPDIQERVAEHLETSLGGETAAATDIPRLTYLKQVIQEALRLYPTVWGFLRRTEREVEVAGNVLPAKATLNIVPYALHRHPEFWPDPERFDPDRFSAEQIRNRDSFAYLPFGAGPRACLGAEMALLEAQLILAQIVPRLRMRHASDRPVAAEAKLTLMPRGGVSLIVSRRQVRPTRRSAPAPAR